MDREILFKAKRKDNGEWVKGYYVFIKGVHYIYTGELRSGGLYVVPERFEIDPSTICWYTGLTDKNGKKIWENGIVKTNRGRLCKVIWFSSPKYQGWDLIPIETKNPSPSQWDIWEDLEFIGNIFDNPELLKGGDSI